MSLELFNRLLFKSNKRFKVGIRLIIKFRNLLLSHCRDIKVQFLVVLGFAGLDVIPLVRIFNRSAS